VLVEKYPVPAEDKSGLHFCFELARRTDIDAFHRAAPTASGRNNGKPGVRKDHDDDYDAAFIADPDGCRLEAYTTSPQ